MDDRSCKHCGRTTRGASRGLCWPCFKKPHIRAMYPVIRNTAPLARMARALRVAFREPLEPTTTTPGTEERIRVYQQRVDAGEQVFHPKDTTFWTSED